MVKTYKGKISTLEENQIFVFGSNPEGRHGKGAAKLAKERFGAIYGKGRGFAGQSYALVTKNLKPKDPKDFDGNSIPYFQEWNEDRGELIIYKNHGERSVTPQQIVNNIEDLYKFAIRYPNKEFFIVYGVDKNLNGYTVKEMATFFSMFKIPDNMIFNEEFAKYLSPKK